MTRDPQTLLRVNRYMNRQTNALATLRHPGDPEIAACVHASQERYLQRTPYEKSVYLHNQLIIWRAFESACIKLSCHGSAKTLYLVDSAMLHGDLFS